MQSVIKNVPSEDQKIKINSRILIHSPGKHLVFRIKKANTFKNPKFEVNKEHGYSNWQILPAIETFRLNEDGSIIVPRGYLPDLMQLCEECDVILAIEDLRNECPAELPALKGIELRPYQERAVVQAMQSDQGVIVSPTGSGKSLIGLELIRRRGQKALILVHRTELASQWIALIKERFGITAGFIGNGVIDIGEQITIAMVQTLALCEEETKTLSDSFGLIILDEVHHAPATTFFDVLGFFSAKYRYGLSATPGRRDGLEPMIYLAIGKTIATISKKEVEEIGATVPATVVSVKTGFNPGVVNSWHEYLDSISSNANRNIKIINLAQQSQDAVLILTDRVSHADLLSEMLNRRQIDHVLAHGKIGKSERKDVMDRIRLTKITVGTTSLLGEGLDVSMWVILIIASPIFSEIKLLQSIGRITRSAPGKKKAIVYDLRDDCGFSGGSFKRRFEIYKKNKMWVEFS